MANREASRKEKSIGELAVEPTHTIPNSLVSERKLVNKTLCLQGKGVFPNAVGFARIPCCYEGLLAKSTKLQIPETKKTSRLLYSGIALAAKSPIQIPPVCIDHTKDSSSHSLDERHEAVSMPRLRSRSVGYRPNSASTSFSSD